MARTTVREWWVDLCSDAGISGVSLHGIRATFITRALDRGVPLVTVQKLAGHADPSMTMRYYRNTEQSQSSADTIRSAIGLAGFGPENGATPSNRPNMELGLSVAEVK